MDTPFYLFGSEDSTDYDILVSIDDIPQNIDAAHNICKHYNKTLSEIFTDKVLNCNLATFKDGEITNVFKGTCDELNNVLFYTYKNHKQYYPNPILKPIERDLNEKVLRAARFILTIFSRTELRPEIKPALRGNLIDKLAVLKKIDFVKMTDFPNKKENKVDLYKSLAFQFGQVFSLIDGFEMDSYAKSGIIKNYPDLKNHLKRHFLSDTDLNTLNKYLSRFIEYIETNLSSLRLNEQTDKNE